MKIGAMSIFGILVLVVCCLSCYCLQVQTIDGFIEGVKLIKCSRNAVYLLDSNGTKHHFPDFYTFDYLGFNTSSVDRIDESELKQIPLGSQIASIPAPPAFRPDDYLYHELCGNPRRMVC